MAHKSVGNPMIEMAMKAMGIDAGILQQANLIGDAFRRMLESLAELHVKEDRQTEMLLSIQMTLGIIPPPDVGSDRSMAQLIADESRKHMGRTIIMDDNTGNDAVSGIVAVAYVKLEELLKIREGVKLYVYPDTKGLATCGIGHLVRDADNLEMDDPITQEQCDAFFREDARSAMDAAIAQMKEAEITSVDFLPWLASVNFQLGTGWTHEFKSTWNMILAGSYTRAADHLAHSRWAEQTLARVQDFQRALRALPPKPAGHPVVVTAG